MPHETSLIATIAVGLGFAFVGGYLASLVRLPPLVGYLLAGIAVGPFTPGFVADARLAPQLAEIGVILLMFGVGMHFSLRDLWTMRRIALPGAIVQIIVATAMGIAVASLWGWSLGAGLVLGLALSVASTVVLLRGLESLGMVKSHDGKIAIGWLIVEDLVMVLVLVLLPPFVEVLGGHAPGGEHAVSEIPPVPAGLWASLAVTLAKLAVFAGLMLVGGARFFPWLLRQVERTRSRELFTLAVIGLAVGVTFLSAHLFGVSFALGAFFAGVAVSESELSHRAAEGLESLQDAFGALFFVAVGMLFDPSILVRDPLRVLAVVAVIVVGKSLAATGIVVLLRHPLATALTVAAGLAQIGEFSFILAGLGVSTGMLPKDGESLILAGALLSITVNPLAFYAASRVSHNRGREATAA